MKKDSFKYFNKSRTKNNIGTMDPKFGMSSVYGRMTITDISKIFRSISLMPTVEKSGRLNCIYYSLSSWAIVLFIELNYSDMRCFMF